MHKGNTPRIACDLTADEDAAEGDAEGDQGPAARDKVEGLRERGRARDAVLVVLHGVIVFCSGLTNAGEEEDRTTCCSKARASLRA